jgi:protease-4
MNFIKNVFSSCLGALLALTVLLIAIIGIGSAIGSMGAKPSVKSSSILHVKVPTLMPERTNNVSMGFNILTEENVWSVHELAYAIKRAGEDSKIKAMVIEAGPTLSFVHMNIIRSAIKEFKLSGKPVYAYGDYYGQSNLYLCSVADELFLNPLGKAELKGFAVIEPFMKDALASIGIEMEVYYAGDFKSATEPFRRNSMSEENRRQIKEFVSDFYSQFLDSLSFSRNIEKSELVRIANTYASRNANDALNLGLVDHIGYSSDLNDALKTKLDSEDKTLYLIDLSDYRSSIGKKRNYSANNKIAIVYMEGEFREGKHEEGQITSEKYVPIFRKLAKDDRIKAVVLRINSGGGNAITADKILNEIRRLKATGKYVISSLGDVAASGGYYVCAASDSIFASPMTITGSIGVYSMFPNFSGLVQNKLGIKLDSVNTSPLAGLGNLAMERSDEEKAIFQEMTDSIYLTFLDIVADGRDMTRDEVHEVAQGRVWTGSKGLEHNLVDKMATLKDAVESAAAIADVEEYRIVEYPAIKSPIERLSDEINKMSDPDRQIKSAVNSVLPQMNVYKRMLENANWVQTKLPYQLKFD